MMARIEADWVVVGGGTNLPTIAAAERVSDLIRGARPTAVREAVAA
jgi:hypothetical protein